MSELRETLVKATMIGIACIASLSLTCLILFLLPLPWHESGSFFAEGTTREGVAIAGHVRYDLEAARVDTDYVTDKYDLPDLVWDAVEEDLKEIFQETVARKDLAELKESLVLDHEVGSALRDMYKNKFEGMNIDLTGEVKVSELRVVLTTAR